MHFAYDNDHRALTRTEAAAYERLSTTGVRRIALIGNYLPRRCGIATFTSDIHRAFARRFPEIAVDVWAMNDHGRRYPYSAPVVGSIDDDDPRSYLAAGRAIAESAADLVWIQHEFGIFGGPAGDLLLTLLARLDCRVAVTLHTILSCPDPAQRRVMDALIVRCETLIVMAEEGRRLLIDIYGADPSRICVIPHGIPDRPFAPTAPMKARLGLGGREVILTFGLLSPGKGVETMLAAMPAIIERVPTALFIILGATHPHSIATSGEAYRDELKALAARLDLGDHVRWIDAFVETDELLDYLEAADIYVQPYLNPAQSTSGTPAYAVGLGKPVVATPYIHARELLADGHGHLVDFGDSRGFADTIITLLGNPQSLLALRKRTYALGRTMIWPRFAEAAVARFNAPMAVRPRFAHAQAVEPVQAVRSVTIARKMDRSAVFLPGAVAA